jgi:hypothetical protein
MNHALRCGAGSVSGVAPERVDFIQTRFIDATRVVVIERPLGKAEQSHECPCDGLDERRVMAEGV